MSKTKPIVHFVCGKVAAGKSTLCQRLAEPPASVLISEDFWLARVFAGEITTLEDYVRCSNRIKVAIGPHVVDLLGAGVSVVLDFPGNTLNQRKWMRGIFESAGARHRLHYLDVPDDVCKARLRKRNRTGNHAFTVSDDLFDLITRHFVPPTSEEGFDLVLRDEHQTEMGSKPD